MIKKTYTFDVPITEVWDALTDRNLILEWSGHPATMDARVGTQFSLWEGDVHGTNMEVQAPNRLVQNWFGGDWEAPSVVTFTLRQDDGLTIVDLEHTGIPPDEKADFEQGWDDYYMGPIKELLEPEAFDDGLQPGDLNPKKVYDPAILDIQPEDLQRPERSGPVAENPAPTAVPQNPQPTQTPQPTPTPTSPDAPPPPANPNQPPSSPPNS